MIIATFGFPLLAYVCEISQSFTKLIDNCLLMIFVSMIVNIYFILMRKYGKKIIPERFFAHIGMLPIIALFFVPIILMHFDDFIRALLWVGVIALSVILPQYARINAYFVQKNTNRYGNTLDIVNKKKEGTAIYDDKFSFTRNRWKHTRYY
jgi:hypothetical protein